jgi:hypothetical protein
MCMRDIQAAAKTKFDPTSESGELMAGILTFLTSSVVRKTFDKAPALAEKVRSACEQMRGVLLE